MILRRFYNDSLAQASFLVGCGKTREAIVIDPNRHIEDYMESAADEGLRITAVTETHIHADYLSGSRELAARTGATLYLSDEGDAEWKYGFANESNVRLVKNGDSIRAGNVRLDVLYTPGHTPEHISFLLTDEASAEAPLGIFSGDFVFVGDVGRPDLLERAANFKGTMEKGARVLYQSLARFKELPDHLIVWPAHGAGSACGKALGGVPISTLAYEKMANWALQMGTEDGFVEEVLAGQPEPPYYFKEMKRLNKIGPPLVGGFRPPARLAGSEILSVTDRGEVLVDVRPGGVAATGYVPGSVNIPLDRSFVNWSGWLIPYDRPIYLLAESAEDAETAAKELLLIGLDNVAGWFGRDALRAYEGAHGTLPVTAQSSMRDAVDQANQGCACILDVRGQTEFEEAHVPGACHIPLGYLRERASELPKDQTILVHCGGGVRSAIAASVLHKAGFADVANIPGGFYEYLELKPAARIG